jgi:hypothetical protein
VEKIGVCFLISALLLILRARRTFYLWVMELGAAIVRRAQALVQQRLEQLDSAQHGTSQLPAEQPQGQPQSEAISTLPEAPVSITLKPPSTAIC